MWLDHSVSGIVAMTSVMVAVSLLSIALRFWSRTVVMGRNYGLDDWLALAALPPTLVLLIGVLWVGAYGVGGPNISPPAHHLERLLIALWTGAYGFNISIGLSKLSMLAFYARIFGPWKLTSVVWKTTFSFTVLFTVAWILAETFYNTFRCDPVIKAARPDLPGHCASLNESLLTSAVLNIANDVMILLLPMPQLFKLQMDWRQKLLVCATLFLGYSIAILSVGRLAVVIAVIKHPFQNVIFLYWLVAETALSLLGVSLPAIYQLIQRGWLFGPRSLLSSQDISELVSQSQCSHSASLEIGHLHSPISQYISETDSLKPLAPYAEHVRAGSSPSSDFTSTTAHAEWSERSLDPP